MQSKLTRFEQKKYFRLRSLLCLLAAMLVCLSGCGGAAVSTVGVNTGAAIENGYVDDLPADAGNGLYKATAEELEALTRMKSILSNEHLELYIGTYDDIAVLDKATGSVFFSNKAIYDKTVSLNPTGKGTCYSVLELTYYDNANKVYTLNSYADKSDAVLETDGNTATVTFSFGTKNMNDIICATFLLSDFEALEEVGQQKIEEGAITKVEFARFKSSYKKVIYADLTAAEKQIYSISHPTLAEHGALYVLKNPTDIIKNIVSKVSPHLGIDSDYILTEMEKLGMEKNVVDNSSMYFEIPVTYALDGRDLLVSVDTAKVINGEGYYLTRVELLGQFGAALGTEEGYTFIPDGSGAVVENATTTTGQAYLDIPFYGTDFCVETETGVEVAPYAPFPVFGTRAGNKGFFAVVEAGDALGGVTAQVPDGVTPYNTVSPWLNYYVQDTNADDNYVYSKKLPETAYTVRYHLLYGEDATYSGMAQYYQAYLRQTGLLQNQALHKGLTVDLQFICAINKKQFVWGMPMDSIAAASALEDIRTFAGELESASVQGIDYVLQGAVNGGMDFRIPSAVKVEKKIGGKQSYLALTEYVRSVGSQLYLHIDFSKVYKKGNGLSQNLQISRYIDKEVAFISDFDPSLQMKNAERTAFLINPLAYSVILEDFIQANEVYSNKTVCVSSIGAYLSSNFNEKSYVNRQESAALARNALKMLQDANYQVMVDGCNAYTLAYANKIVNVPTACGDYTIESYSVPFAGMVLHGYVDYVGSTLNNQGNYEMALLQSLESGAGLNYLLMTGDSLIFSETQYPDMYNVSAEYWQDKIMAVYQNLNAFYTAVSGQTITAHSRLAENVFKTAYAGGAAIIVNYNNTAVTIDGVEIEALDYHVLME